MQDVEQYLSNYKSLKNRISDMENRIEEVVAHKNSIADRLLKTPRMDDVRVQGGAQSDPVYDAVQKMVDVYGERIDRLRVELRELFCEIDEIQRFVDMAGLSDIEREYVRLRYFEGLRIKEIADRMKYSERHVKNIGRNSLQCFSGSGKELCGNDDEVEIQNSSGNGGT
ncbi:MAG: sigma factor-like helix-turn-helix DNA-binding protein [Oscillospiraceae bacterium]